MKHIRSATNQKPRKLTLEKLARTIQQDFSGVRGDISELRGRVERIESTMATKGELRQLQVVMKEDLRELRHEVVQEVREQNRKVLESNDQVVTRLDTLLKEDAAHTALHKRLDDRVESHEKRIVRLEARR